MRGSIKDYFFADITGVTHKYKADDASKIDIISKILAGGCQSIICINDEHEEYFVTHTEEQLKEVLNFWVSLGKSMKDKESILNWNSINKGTHMKIGTHLTLRDVFIRAIRLAHDTNTAWRVICEQTTEHTESLSWDNLSQEEQEQRIERVEEICRGEGLSCRESWQKWKENKIASGYKLGPTIDLVAKTHPNLVEQYDHLPIEERIKDALHTNIIQTVCTHYRVGKSVTTGELVLEPEINRP